MMNCTRSILLVLAAFSLGGCYSVYHTTMREYRQSPSDLLRLRMVDAQQTLDEARGHLERTVEIARDMSGVQPGKRSGAARALDVAMNKAELALWNTGRRILAVHDRMERDGESQPIVRAKRETISAVLAEMDLAQREMHSTLVHLRQQSDVDGVANDAERAQRLAQLIAEMGEDIEQVMDRARRATTELQAVLDSLDEYVVASVDDGRAG